MSTTTKRKLNVNKRTTPSFVEPEMVLKSRLNGSANGKHSKAADYQGSRVQAMLDNAPVNILYADVNLKIKYSNLASTLALEQISKYLPAMESIIGQSLGIFFKNPERQCQLWSDPKNLPQRILTNLGLEIIDLVATGIYDPSGQYLGPMVTWEIVTKKISTRQKVQQTAESLASSSEDMTAISQSMSSNATETAAQATAVSAAAEQVSKNVQTVATGAQEMTASNKEISKNAAIAARVATSAVKAADITDTTMNKLGESSAQIGKVIKVITGIAQQTNLLALNATIEAARAGESGRGFAVVANEVKELAKETAAATEQISQKIEAIQTDTREAIKVIGEIKHIINQISDIQNTIASSVEEQTATANEISRNVADAARASSEIARNITGVAMAAGNTNQGAANCEKSAKQLSQIAAELEMLVVGDNEAKSFEHEGNSGGHQ